LSFLIIYAAKINKIPQTWNVFKIFANRGCPAEVRPRHAGRFSTA